MTELTVLFVLLPLAAVSGWLVGRGATQRRNRQRRELSSQYFRGINYLLNEESDKAIEEFLKLAEVNRDTVDTHLALGTLFRRRGEMDKAIRYHAHIMARPNLDEDQRERVLFELALDYARSGLLDRAERLFMELADSTQVGVDSRRHLLDIYLQEKDWAQAIEQAQRLEFVYGEPTSGLVAQLYCELADSALADDDIEQAFRSLRQARRFEPANARARLIEAEIARRRGDPAASAARYREAMELDPDLLVTNVETVVECHRRIDAIDELMAWLAELDRRTDLHTPALLLARLTAEHDSRKAGAILLETLERRASVRGLALLMELLQASELGLEDVGPELIANLMGALIQAEPVHRCENCGFSGSAHHWMCPSCRSWNSTRVIRGVLGE